MARHSSEWEPEHPHAERRGTGRRDVLKGLGVLPFVVQFWPGDDVEDHAGWILRRGDG